MITIENIRKGIHWGVIRFVTDPISGHGTVCQIGESWFSFGGLTSEEEDPATLLKNADMDNVINDIFNALESFWAGNKKQQDAYKYYDAYLKENKMLMDTYWDRIFRYYLNDGKFSGIVVADSEEDAKSKVLAAYKTSPAEAKRDIYCILVCKAADLGYDGLSPDVFEIHKAGNDPIFFL